MEEQYSINEILNAINDLSDIKKEKIVSNSSAQNSLKKSDIPSNTLKLIEEAEENIGVKDLIK
tara:strand:+ start:409 stop:597 length:189 start_codon:yes stop_codon:yes gene_type:complete